MQHTETHTFTKGDLLGEAKAGFIYQRLNMITQILGQMAPRDVPNNMTKKVDAHCCVRTQEVLQLVRQ